ncbi:MAG: GAF domain-containing protein [Caldilineaceae bacterium]
MSTHTPDEGLVAMWPPPDKRSSLDAGLHTNVPAEKLLVLMEASSAMLQSSLRRDRKAALETVVYHVHELLEVEACAIFLVPDASPSEVILSASYTDKRKFDFPLVRRKIQSVPGGGLTGHVANVGKIIRLHGAELANHPYKTTHGEHLVGGNGFSMLSVPLKDRKAHLLGVMIVDNKKGANGIASTETSFTDVDVSIAQILANQVVSVLENLRIFETLREVVSATQTTQSLEQTLNIILSKGLTLLYADRGEFVLWSEAKRDLMIAAQAGESMTALKDKLAPEPSIVRTLWYSQQPSIFLPDVTNILDAEFAANYYPSNPRTQCEIAVLLQKDQRKIGILNVESYRQGGLDAQDIEVLELLAQYATIAIQAVEKQSFVSAIVGQLGDSQPPRQLLNNILETVRSIYGLSGGIIYIAEDKNQLLRCAAYLSDEPLDIKEPSNFSYRYDQQSLATQILQTRAGYFCADPFRDPIVNPIGLTAFHIRSAIVGVPLIFDQKVVGVLVCWDSQDHHLLTEIYIHELKPFARLAAAHIAISESERRRKNVLEEIGKILTQMQGPLSLEDNLHVILRGIQVAGFDRVRIFRYDAKEQTFIGLEAVGMINPSVFRGTVLSATTNRYSQEIAMTGVSNPQARLYDPLDLKWFGVDPDASRLDKPSDMPWASVPLVIGGKLYGQISADNAHSHQAITDESLEYMTLVGALAAQTIANAETIEMLRASRLKDEFLQRMVHIFGTMTARVQLLVDNIRDGVVNNERALQEYIPAIAKVNERFLGLSQTMIDFAALQEDTKLNLELVALTTLIAEATEHVQALALAHHIRFVTTFLCPSCLYRVDPLRILNALEALLDNAIKFSPPGGLVFIQMDADEGAIQITIRDQGAGILPEDLPFIFDSFYRGENARIDHIDGTGLGLAIVDQTMKLHGGATKARNHPNGGAEFSLVFPKHPDEE